MARTARFGRLAIGLVLLGSVLFSLAILEAGARALRLGNVGTPYVLEDPDTIYAHIPGKRGRMESPGEFAIRFAINDKALRGREVAYERSGADRVLAIGDSFTFGVGANDDETWPAALERELRTRRPGRAVEVVNGGTQGWGLAEYWIWLEKEGHRYAPDDVVVAVHASDWTSADRGLVTLDDAGRPVRHRREAAGIGRLKEITARIPGYETLMEWSVLASFLKTRLAHRMRGGTTQTLEATGADGAGLERFDRGWPINRAVLLELERRVDEIGGGLALVFIPTWEHVLGEPGYQGSEARFREALRAHAEERGLGFADMTPLYRAASPDAEAVEAFYHRTDGHCTPEGYARIAQAAAALLEAEAASASQSSSGTSYRSR